MECVGVLCVPWLPMTMKISPEIFKWHRCALQQRSFTTYTSFAFISISSGQKATTLDQLFGSLLFKWLHNAQILLAIREAHTNTYTVWSCAQFKFPVCWVSSIDMIFSESNRHSHIINFAIQFGTITHSLTASMQRAISIENICKPSVHRAHTHTNHSYNVCILHSIDVLIKIFGEKSDKRKSEKKLFCHGNREWKPCYSNEKWENIDIEFSEKENESRIKNVLKCLIIVGNPRIRIHSSMASFVKYSTV